MAPGTKIALGVIRDGKPATLNLTVGEFHNKTDVAGNGGDDEQPNGKIGLEVAELAPEARQQFNVPDHVHGVVVQNVRPASPAGEAGIQPGDVILEIDRKPTESISQFADELRQNKDGKDLLMLVWSKGNASYRTIHADQGNQND
jgi:serine protease Do